MKIKQIRDITLVHINEDTIMGVSVDSCGGIGEKINDTIYAPTKLVGSQTAKVLLAELISMGFQPKIISDGIANEMNDTGEKIISGIKETLSKLKNSDIHITGSTEENAITNQTAIGTTCIGFAKPEQLKYKCSLNGDMIALAGMLAVGPEVVNNPDKILQIEDFEYLSEKPFIHQIVPVGSKGAEYEADILCMENNMTFCKLDSSSVDFHKSGGPSCAAILSFAEKDKKKIVEIFDKLNKSLRVIGYMRREDVK